MQDLMRTNPLAVGLADEPTDKAAKGLLPDVDGTWLTSALVDEPSAPESRSATAGNSFNRNLQECQAVLQDAADRLGKMISAGKSIADIPNPVGLRNAARNVADAMKGGELYQR